MNGQNPATGGSNPAQLKPLGERPYFEPPSLSNGFKGSYVTPPSGSPAIQPRQAPTGGVVAFGSTTLAPAAGSFTRGLASGSKDMLSLSARAGGRSVGKVGSAIKRYPLGTAMLGAKALSALDGSQDRANSEASVQRVGGALSPFQFG